MFEKYIVNVYEFFEKGYVELVIDDFKGREGYTWYFFYYFVLYLRKLDKCRFVYDCFVKYRGVSLNDKVY